jgi:hypothetical protein
MMSLPEQTTKKTLVTSIVALLSNGYKQRFHRWLLTYSVHVTIYIVARMRRLYKTGIGLTAGFIRSHTITVHTIYNSLLQLQLFSEDCCSTRILTCNWSCPAVEYYLYSKLYSLWTDPKENTSPIPLLLECHYRNGPQRKRWSLPLLRCMATAVNKRLTVDCWPTACTSQYVHLQNEKG